MNELELTLFGLIGLGVSFIVLWFMHMPKAFEDRDMDIKIALGIGLLILIVDRKQDRHLHEITESQHNLTVEIREVIEEQMKILRELQRSGQST